MSGDSRNILKAEPCGQVGKRQEGEGPPSAITVRVPEGQLGSLGPDSSCPRGHEG